LVLVRPWSILTGSAVTERGEGVTLCGEVLIIGGDAGVSDLERRYRPSVPIGLPSPGLFTEPLLRHFVPWTSTKLAADRGGCRSGFPSRDTSTTRSTADGCAVSGASIRTFRRDGPMRQDRTSLARFKVDTGRREPDIPDSLERSHPTRSVWG